MFATFHHGEFPLLTGSNTDSYGDSSVKNAALNGRIYTNTDPSDLPNSYFGTFTATTDSTKTTYIWTPYNSGDADVLLVAGGGGGGQGHSGAGGGGGGVVQYSQSLQENVPVTIVVGNGGSGSSDHSVKGSNGSDSSLNNIIAKGGGGAGSRTNSAGASGGSGGGGSRENGPKGLSAQSTNNVSLALLQFGNDGGIGNQSGAGGGGAGGAGIDGSTDRQIGRDGGDGATFTQFGNNPIIVGAGGGSGAYPNTADTVLGKGGSGIGGNGGIMGATNDDPDSPLPTAGKEHTGSGGGGSGGSGSGGADGGSGIVLIMYRDTYLPNTFIQLDANEFSETRVDNTPITSWNGYAAEAVGNAGLPVVKTDEPFRYVRFGTPENSATVGNYLDVGDKIITRENPKFTSDTTVVISDSGWDTGDGWVVSASSTLGDNHSPWQALNTTIAGGWHSGGFSTTNPEWLSIEYPYPVSITSYDITSRDNASFVWFPTKWVLQGSNVGTPDGLWIDLEEERNISSWIAAETKTFSDNVNIQNNAYKYYRLLIRGGQRSNGNLANTHVGIGNWSLYTASKTQIWFGRDTNPAFTSDTTVALESNSGWNTNIGWKAAASSINPSIAAGQTTPFEAWKGLNKTTVNDSSWISSNRPTVENPEWLSIEYPYPVSITSYDIKSRWNPNPWFPKKWVLQGSNNEVSWIDLEEERNISAWIGAETKTFTNGINIGNNAYKYYRLLIRGGRRNNTNASDNIVGIGNWSLNMRPGFTAVGVIRFWAAKTWQRWFDFGNGAGVQNILYRAPTNNVGARFQIFNNVSLDTTDPYVVPVGNGWHIVVARGTTLTDSTLLETWSDPNSALEPKYSQTGAASIFTKRTLINNYIGKSNWANDHHACLDVRETAFYDYSLSDSDLKNLVTHLRLKYGFDPSLPTSGPISLADVAGLLQPGGNINMNSIRTRKNISGKNKIPLSGQIKMSDFYGLGYSGNPTSVPSLYAWYNADSFVNGQWEDASGNGRHATVTGTVNVDTVLSENPKFTSDTTIEMVWDKPVYPDGETSTSLSGSFEVFGSLPLHEGALHFAFDKRTASGLNSSNADGSLSSAGVAWNVNPAVTNVHVGIRYPVAVALKSYVVQRQLDSSSGRIGNSPDEWVVEGTNNPNSNVWTSVHVVSLATGNRMNWGTELDTTEVQNYTYTSEFFTNYRIRFTRMVSTAHLFLRISEVVFYTNTIASTDPSGNTVKKCLRGDTTTSVAFPDGVLPETFTMFHLTRYTGGARKRIFQGVNNDWVDGFNNGKSGVAFHGKWLTQNNSSSFEGDDDWVLSCSQNNMYRANGIQKSILTSSGTSQNIAINTGKISSQASDWACAEVIVYDRNLSVEEIDLVERHIRNANGIEPKNGLSGLSTAGFDSLVAAYSFHRCNQNYSGPAVRVQKGTEEMDFYPTTSGVLHAGSRNSAITLSDWLGSSTGLIHTWYDQSGRGKHATNEGTNKPQILLSADGICMHVSGTTMHLAGPNVFDTTTVSNMHLVMASKEISRLNGPILSLNGSTATATVRFLILAPYSSGVWFADFGDTGTNRAHSGSQITEIGENTVFSGYKSSADNTVFRVNSGTRYVSSGHSAGGVSGGIRFGGISGTLNQHIFSTFIFDQKLSEADEKIVEEYSSVKMPLVRSSGAIDLYKNTGTVAAYALRQLFSTYTGPQIRVKRSGATTTLDVSYDKDGREISVPKLSTFIPSNETAHIVTWYDQSGKNNHGTAVNNPALDYITSPLKHFIKLESSSTYPYIEVPANLTTDLIINDSQIPFFTYVAFKGDDLQFPDTLLSRGTGTQENPKMTSPNTFVSTWSPFMGDSGSTTFSDANGDTFSATTDTLTHEGDINNRFDAFRAFDKLSDVNTRTIWDMRLVNLPVSIALKYPRAQVLHSYAISAQVGINDFLRSPKSWTIEGSNNFDDSNVLPDGTVDHSSATWSVLDNVVDYALSEVGLNEFSMANTDAYSAYRMVVHEHQGTQDLFQIGELVFRTGTGNTFGSAGADYRFWTGGEGTPWAFETGAGSALMDTDIGGGINEPCVMAGSHVPALNKKEFYLRSSGVNAYKSANTVDKSTLVSNTNPMRIGHPTWGFAGDVYEVLIYRADLTAGSSPVHDGIMNNLVARYVPSGGALDDIVITDTTAVTVAPIYTTASVAYSVRRLFTEYTGPQIRVRHSVTSTQADIYTDSHGKIVRISGSTATDLDTWLNSATATADVLVWYDQSGGDIKHASSYGTNEQPKLEVYEGKLAIRFNGTTERLNFADTDVRGVYMEFYALAYTNNWITIFGRSGADKSFRVGQTSFPLGAGEWLNNGGSYSINDGERVPSATERPGIPLTIWTSITASRETAYTLMNEIGKGSWTGAYRGLNGYLTELIFTSTGNQYDDDHTETTLATLNTVHGSFYNTRYTLQAAPYNRVLATGGTITDVGGYRIHEFTSTEIAKFTVMGDLIIDVIIVGGGGSGGTSGGSGGAGGGGGGAGGFIESYGISLSSVDYDIVVGNGGAGGVIDSHIVGNNGSNSSAFNLVAIGGGGGGTGAPTAGSDGGSGGGGGTTIDPTVRTAPGNGASLQGNNGGTSINGSGGGGGGGATQVGGDATNGIPGKGGDGITTNFIPGYSKDLAGGGSGSSGSTYGIGGLGGGGNATNINGLTNTGGGGAGGNGGGAKIPSGSGGSGIVLIRYIF